ncbi:MAG: MBL fold metallo-hydrolase, partial [Acidobacteria bacterium]|nr:MBL fold metallo-hydrolase [Acidobacteriota bacterium]
MIQLGGLSLELVPTGRFRLDGGAMFGVVPKVLWERVSRPDEKNRIELALNCLLVRDGRRTIVVETGMGEKWGPKEREIYALSSSGGLREELRRRGVAPESVDVVILTHLHFDHAGGATVARDSGEAVPAFPNATYYVQKQEWEFATHANERTRASYVPENFQPLFKEGVLKFLQGEQEVLPGVSVLPLPGHTPGLQGVLLRGGGVTALFPSDLIPTVAHLPIPYIMGYDVLPLTTLETKKRVFPQALREGWRLLLVHEPATPIGILREDQGKI